MDNVFNFPNLRVPHTALLDDLDRAIGVYRSWVGPLWRSLFNPFYWLGRGLTLIARIPFRILDAVGYDGTKAEGSKVGKFIQAVIQFGTVIGGGITALEKLDLLEPVKLVVHRFLGIP